MKVFFKMPIIVTLAVILINISISVAFAEFGEYYTNSDLEKYKYDSTDKAGVLTNSDLKVYENRYKATSERVGISNWKDELLNICKHSARSQYLSDERLYSFLKKSDYLRDVIEELDIAASQKYTHLITLENCRQPLLTEAQQRERDSEISEAESLLRQEHYQKSMIEHEALEQLIAYKIRHSYDRIRALQIRFCDFRQDPYASYISCGHKLRLDGLPFTAMKLKQRINGCINPDTCFYTTDRQVSSY